MSHQIGFENLTAKEWDVLELIADGKANKEIGVLLGMSEYTVKSHVKRIFDKLDVDNRAAAAAEWAKHEAERPKWRPPQTSGLF